MARTQVLKFADRALGGKLPGFLEAWRREGLSYEAIARRLASDYGVTVSGETIRMWCKSLEIVAKAS